MPIGRIRRVACAIDLAKPLRIDAPDPCDIPLPIESSADEMALMDCRQSIKKHGEQAASFLNCEKTHLVTKDTIDARTWKKLNCELRKTLTERDTRFRCLGERPLASGSAARWGRRGSDDRR